MYNEKEYQKKYRLANKERIKAKQREYYLRNKAKRISKAKEDHVNSKHKPLVYLLTKENYVGVTENIKYRLRYHKNNMSRNIDDFRILAEFETREQAIELEEFLHELGYSGKHKFNVYK
jgi:predicted GIY-YIG superfamily endonuclease